MKEAIIFILLFCPAIQLAGQILKVPTEFSTIQQAINQANNGDTIMVDEGCIDTGHPDPAYTDRDGSRNDMGAYEFGTVTHHGKLFSGDAIKLYPNPAGDKVIITTESTEILTLELFDYTGKLIAIERFVSGDQMDIRNLEPGIYLATIKNGSAVVGIKKLIKK
mgnify:CR=1 FL=1